MGKDERILFVVVILGAILALIYKFRSAASGAVSYVAGGDFVTNLTYNQPSFANSSVAGVLPQAVASQLGVGIDAAEFSYSDCGCY